MWGQRLRYIPRTPLSFLARCAQPIAGLFDSQPASRMNNTWGTRSTAGPLALESRRHLAISPDIAPEQGDYAAFSLQDGDHSNVNARNR